MAEKDRNWFARHKILSVIIAIVIIGGIASAMGGNKSDTATNTGTNNGNQTEKTGEKTEFKVGETATFDDKSITVTDVKRNYDTGNQFAQPESGKEFVIVTVNIVNNSSSSLDYNTFEFKMQDTNGVQQSEAFTALTEGKLNQWFAC